MSFLRKLHSDEQLSRVLHNSIHLFSSNSISLGLSILQSLLAARMLGPSNFGLIAIVMSYASTVNGLLSFRMSELVVRYGGKYLAQNEQEKAAALVKAAGIAEAIVSALAFAAVAVTAGLGARFIAKTPGSEWMFILYSIGLLANFNAETATGVLQITNRIKVRGYINLIQSIIGTGIILLVYLADARSRLDPATGLLGILAAYLIGKVVLGLGLVVTARKELTHVLGENWSKARFSVLPSFNQLFGFAFSSNLSATAILVFRESEPLWVGFFLSKESAGLFKIAYTVVNFLSVPADPLILSVYPETNRLIVQKAWDRLRSFLRKVTVFSLVYNLLLALGLVLFGHWVLTIFGDKYATAYPAMLALLPGLVYNYTLFWNRPVLLSLGLQGFALYAILMAGFIKIALAFALVPRYGYVMEAALLSLYYLFSVSLIVGKGLIAIQKQQAGKAAPLSD